VTATPLRHPSRMRRAAAVAAVLAAGAATALAAAPSGAATRTASPGVVVKTATGPHGTVLVTAKGFTLYRYTPDKPNDPTCTGACATVWPPLTVPGRDRTPKAASGIRGLATVKLADGRRQVTLDDIPLYLYVADRSAGQENGQGVGGVWYVVSPTTKAAPTTTAGGSGGYGY
jgi:predicted lipoprotein with Yx(FWY)xxD motif